VSHLALAAVEIVRFLDEPAIEFPQRCESGLSRLFWRHKFIQF
jgi:hypothetical protein